MNVDKIRNLTDIELVHQQRELSDQLFKMKFQLKMGQTESLKKIRELKKDIARVLTVMRQKQLAGDNGADAGSGNSRQRSRPGKEGGQEEGCDGEKVIHGGNHSNQHCKGRRPAQDLDWRSRVDQDGQDHRGGSAAAESPPVL